MNNVDLSVIVATRNRANSLFRLLDSLSQQIDPPNFQVIVSDNGSYDHTSEVVKNASKLFPIHYIKVPRPGKSHALNETFKHAIGSLLVFTDDDVVANSSWLRFLYEASINFKDCNIFGGRIDVDFKYVPEWVRKSFNLKGLLTSAHNLGDSFIRYGYGAYPFGPNMAIRRHLIAGLIAPYPENMGPGALIPIGDETGFLIRFSPPESKDRLYVPSACVMHEVEPENVAFKTALIRCFLAGRAIGLLGLPPVANRDPKTVSIKMVMLERLRSCASPQELICIIARYLGYISEKNRSQCRN